MQLSSCGFFKNVRAYFLRSTCAIKASHFLRGKDKHEKSQFGNLDDGTICSAYPL